MADIKIKGSLKFKIEDINGNRTDTGSKAGK